MIEINKLVYTVFTPTFNRKELLFRCFESLKEQTFKQFEWVVVDDGSNDGTDMVIANLQSNAQFPVRYIWQRNRGKHCASNLASKIANGDLFLTFDSDDECLPNALERLYEFWIQIPLLDRGQFSGVSCLCMTPEGDLIGNNFRSDVVDYKAGDIESRDHEHGERWGFHRTSIMREFPFPETSGERFIPEALVWNRIALKYRLRCVNEALRIMHYSKDGLSRKMYKIRKDSPSNTLLYYSEQTRLPHNLLSRWRAGCNYWRFWLATRSPSVKEQTHRPHWLYNFFTFPIGFALWVVDAARTKNR